MKKLTPFIKWPGGKTSELEYIKSNKPEKFERYFEPFLGGGAVFLEFSNYDVKFYLNDISDELINIYNNIKYEKHKFIEELNIIWKNWIALEVLVNNKNKHLINLFIMFNNDEIDEMKLYNKFEEFSIENSSQIGNLLSDDFNPDIERFLYTLNKTLLRKFKRMKKLEIEKGSLNHQDYIKNIETAFKSTYYTHLRYIYNNRNEFNITPEKQDALFYFLREYSYSSMFRFNRKNEFNVPYGGLGYNKKNFKKKIDALSDERLINLFKKSEFYSLDFSKFNNMFNYTDKDFIFLDPPYDSEFSDYGLNKFSQNDHLRLSKFLLNTKANVLMVIKDTVYIRSLYENKGLVIDSFNKKYSVNFKSRNNREVKHLIIKNY